MRAGRQSRILKFTDGYTCPGGQAEEPVLSPMAENQQVWVNSNRWASTDGYGTQPWASAYLGLLLLHGLLGWSHEGPQWSQG